MKRIITYNQVILSLYIIINVVLSFSPRTTTTTIPWQTQQNQQQLNILIKNRNNNSKYNYPKKTSSLTKLKMNSNDFTPLAKEGEWAAYLDETDTGFVYYFNGKTGESLWEPPSSTFPKIKLTQKKLKVIQQKQAEYLSTVEDGNGSSNTNDNAFSFSKVFDVIVSTANRNDGQDVAVEEGAPNDDELKTVQPSGFNFFGNNNKKSEIVKEETSQTTTTTKQQKLPLNLFSFGKPATTATQKTSDLQIISSSQVLPHPDKVSWGGEDAVLCLSRTYGIFDGVSGADKLDGVPLYSNTLSEILEETIQKEVEQIDGLNGLDLKNLLTNAAEYADATATGASTALVASIDKDGYLHVLNVGDSTLLVLRQNSIVARSREIVHYFDCPFQLAEDSPDRPKDGTKFKRLLQPGDVVLMGSDGIFDNLTDEQICNCVSNPKYQNNPTLLLRVIINEARKVSLDKDVLTPYSQMAKRYGYEEYASGLGGKVDDISGIIALCS